MTTSVVSLKITPMVFQCGSERGSDSVFEERLMDAEIASGPNTALLWIKYFQQRVIVSFQSIAQTIIPLIPRSDSKPVHAGALRGANRGRSEESFWEGNPRKLDRKPGDQKSWNPRHQFQFNQQVPDEICIKFPASLYKVAIN